MAAFTLRIRWTLQRPRPWDQSTSWSNLTANGTTINLYGTLNLTGTDSSQNVFSLSGADLTGSSSINITAPTGSTVIINVSGSGQTFQNGQVSLNGIESGNVIYNFFESTSIHLAGSKNPNGSILAAWADVTGGYGAMDGQLIAQSFDGNTEFHNKPFVGTVPLPAAFWLFGSALGFLSMLSHRRKKAS
jgi:choice-of-anchor A domain-containing protein